MSPCFANPPPVAHHPRYGVGSGPNARPSGYHPHTQHHQQDQHPRFRHRHQRIPLHCIPRNQGIASGHIKGFPCSTHIKPMERIEFGDKRNDPGRRPGLSLQRMTTLRGYRAVYILERSVISAGDRLFFFLDRRGNHSPKAGATPEQDIYIERFISTLRKGVKCAQAKYQMSAPNATANGMAPSSGPSNPMLYNRGSISLKRSLPPCPIPP